MRSILIWAFLLISVAVSAQTSFKISGIVRDSLTGEPLPGVAVEISGTNKGTSTDQGGVFLLAAVPRGRHTLLFSSLSYSSGRRELEVGSDIAGLDLTMNAADVETERVVVTAKRKTNTETSMVGTLKFSPQVVSGISAGQIARSPDSNASQVVRRVPGVTIIDDRLVIVRGLAQRYNNAWIDGLPVPGTETDSRAFSLDLIPGSQIDNLVVCKSPSPEIPGDFSGGFVKIATKGVPGGNAVEAGMATGFNLNTQSREFLRSEGWGVRGTTPLPDRKMSLSAARRFDLRNGSTLGNITALNYSNTSKSVVGIENDRYGIYDAVADAPIRYNDYRDDQYSSDTRLGAMHNWSLRSNSSNSFELKNLLNIVGRERLTQRSGLNLTNSSPTFERQTEMLRTRRLTYSGQLSGAHNFSGGASLGWNAGYSYANRDEPDRRIAKYQAGISTTDDIPTAKLFNESIRRYDQTLDDHLISAAANLKNPLGKATLKTGLYAEHRRRDYRPRVSIYRYTALPADQREAYMSLPLERMMDPEWIGTEADGKVFLDDITNKTDAYSAAVTASAAYAAIEIPLGKLNIYAGARVENNVTELTYDLSNAPGYTRITTRRNEELSLLPSLNAAWKLNEKHQLRAAYGRSVNRPELRELSPTVYYDFDLFSEVGGNPELKTAVVDNADIRYEIYPSPGETVSLGAFYKHFRNPIEWTFIDMGGTYRYLFQNARSAASWGLELDMRKNLGFLGAPNLSIALNAAWIESVVTFDRDALNVQPDRPMQGQSPYILNAGLYYASEKLGLNASLLYNRVGRRIVGIGKSNDVNRDSKSFIPDSYELPRNSLDLSLSKRIGKRLEIKASVGDILSEDVVYKQFPRIEKNGAIVERQQTTKRFNPGQSFSLGVSVRL